MTTPGWSEPKATALLVLADGTVVEGAGIGATGQAAGEVCFMDAMAPDATKEQMYEAHEMVHGSANAPCSVEMM